MALDDEIDRRDFAKRVLKFGGLAVASTLMPAWLAGCLGGSNTPIRSSKTSPTLYELATKEWTFTNTGKTDDAGHPIILAETTHKDGDIITIVDTTTKAIEGDNHTLVLGLESLNGVRDVVVTTTKQITVDDIKKYQNSKVRMTLPVINPKPFDTKSTSYIGFYVPNLKIITAYRAIEGLIYDAANAAGKNTIKII